MRVTKKGFFKTLPYGDVNIKVWVIDAKEPVTLHRTIEDVASGKRGDARRCMDAKCSMRQADKFPHPVKAAWFKWSTAYVLKADNPNGKYPFIAVRYLHTDGRDIEKFDKGSVVDGEKTLTLRPPNGVNRIGGHKPHPVGKRGDRKNPTGRTRKSPAINGRFLSMQMWEEGQRIAATAR